MKTVIWQREHGFTYAIPFDNGFGAERLATFETKAAAQAAIRELEQRCGKDYKNNDFPWRVTSIKTGKTKQLFKWINLVDLDDGANPANK